MNASELDALRERWAAGEERDKLARRLRAARAKIAPDYRRRLALARFDAAGRRLVGDGCELVEVAGRIVPRELAAPVDAGPGCTGRDDRNDGPPGESALPAQPAQSIVGVVTVVGVVRGRL